MRSFIQPPECYLRNSRCGIHGGALKYYGGPLLDSARLPVVLTIRVLRAGAAHAPLRRRDRARGEGAAVHPTPATHAISTDLKAGERVFQTLLLTKTVVQRSTIIVSCTILASKHCLRRFSPAFNESGLRD